MHSGRKGQDFTGFPMIQSYDFNDIKFCGKKILKCVSLDEMGLQRKEFFSFSNSGFKKECLASENNCGT